MHNNTLNLLTIMNNSAQKKHIQLFFRIYDQLLINFHTKILHSYWLDMLYVGLLSVHCSWHAGEFKHIFLAFILTQYNRSI